MKERDMDTLPNVPHWLKHYSIVIMALILFAVYYGFMSLSIERTHEVEVVGFASGETGIIIRAKKINIKNVDEACISFSKCDRQPINSILNFERQEALYILNTSGTHKPEKGEKIKLYLKYKLYKTYLKNGI